MSHQKNKERFLVKKIIVAIVLLLAVFYFVTAAFGTYINYSAVPFWDMWNGYLDFYFRIKSEGWTPWWELHNEHRLVLAKIFFWIDLEYFRGSMVLLFMLNLMFSLLACLTFIMVLKEFLKNTKSKLLLYSLSGVLVVLCFSWLQRENYTWAFQSQFHMAYLLPLLAMLALTKSKTKNSVGLYLIACALGTLSAVTMANGLLALPIMIALAILNRMHWRYVVVLVLIMICVYSVYFVDYVKPPGHPSLLSGIIENPKASINYLLLYLSGPFYGVFLKHQKLAMIMGGVFISGCLWGLWYVLRCRFKNNEEYVKLSGLLAFLVFIGGTALLTSLGRAGYDQNIPSRYMTPAILGWCCLLVFLTAIHYQRIKDSLLPYMAMALLSLALLPVQLKALSRSESLHEHQVAAVAAALGVYDKKIIDRVYFDMDRLFKIIEPAREQGISIFNEKYIKNIYYFGDKFELEPSGKCDFYIDEVEVVTGSPEYSRLDGWAFNKDARKAPDYIVITNSNSRVVGFALTGRVRRDVAETVDLLAVRSGYLGYALSNVNLESEVRIYGVSDEFVCEN